MDDDDLEYNGFNLVLATDRYLKDRCDAPNCTRIVGAFGGAKKRRYICNVCGQYVDSESAQHRVTLHAQRAIDAHVRAHREELLGPTAPPIAYEWVREIPLTLRSLVHLAARLPSARLVVADLLEESGHVDVAVRWRGGHKIDLNLVTVLVRQGSIV